MPQTILGIDIGSYSVKIAQCERGFGEFKFIGFFEIPLIAEGVLTFEQAASAALTKFLEENPIPYDGCVLSLPGTMAAFRTLELPFGNVKKIDQTLEYELETLIPFDIDNTLWDYSILSLAPTHSEVLTAYLSKEDFKKFLAQMQVSGLDPRFVGIDTIDLSYLTNLGVLPPAGRYAILDMGHRKSNFIILEGNQIKSLRCFSWGGHQVTEAIAEAAGLTYDQAEGMKHTKAQIVPGSDDKVYKAIEEQFSDLMQQLKQTLFAFYEGGEGAIEALFLSGGTSRTQGVETFFSNQLNINVSLLDVLDDMYTKIHDRERLRPIVPTALSAAMRGVFPNKGARINFRRGEHAYKRDIQEFEVTAKRIGILAASVVALGMVYFIIANFALSSQVDRMNKNVSKLVKTSVTDLGKTPVEDSKGALDVLKKRVGGANDKLKLLQGEGSVSALQVLKLVSSAMPSRDKVAIDVDKITITPNLVKIEGKTAGSYKALEDIKDSLSKVPNFKNVKADGKKDPNNDLIKFNISMDLES